MKILQSMLKCWIPTVAAGLAACAAAPGEVISFEFMPGDQQVCVGAIVEIDLVLVSDGPHAQQFDSLDAILNWDPAAMTLLGFSNADADIDWFLSGFLSDIDGINDDTSDGDAIFTALAPPGSSPIAPPAPGDLTVTTLRFLVIAESALTEISMPPSIGKFGLSRVLLVGANITGNFAEPAAVSAAESCAADCAEPCNGTVDVNDLLAVLATWGDFGNPCDVDGSGVVDVNDLLAVLAAWGPCP